METKITLNCKPPYDDCPHRIMYMHLGSLKDYPKYVIMPNRRSWIMNGKRMMTRNVRESEVQDPARLKLLKTQIALPWGVRGYAITPLTDGWVDLTVEITDEYTSKALEEMDDDQCLIPKEEWDNWWNGICEIQYADGSIR